MLKNRFIYQGIVAIKGDLLYILPEFDPDDCPPDCSRPCENVCPADAIFSNTGKAGPSKVCLPFLFLIFYVTMSLLYIIVPTRAS